MLFRIFHKREKDIFTANFFQKNILLSGITKCIFVGGLQETKRRKVWHNNLNGKRNGGRLLREALLKFLTFLAF